MYIESQLSALLEWSMDEATMLKIKLNISNQLNLYLEKCLRRWKRRSTFKKALCRDLRDLQKIQDPKVFINQFINIWLLSTTEPGLLEVVLETSMCKLIDEYKKHTLQHQQIQPSSYPIEHRYDNVFDEISRFERENAKRVQQNVLRHSHVSELRKAQKAAQRRRNLSTPSNGQ